MVRPDGDTGLVAMVPNAFCFSLLKEKCSMMPPPTVKCAADLSRRQYVLSSTAECECSAYGHRCQGGGLSGRRSHEYFLAGPKLLRTEWAATGEYGHESRVVRHAFCILSPLALRKYFPASTLPFCLVFPQALVFVFGATRAAVGPYFPFHLSHWRVCGAPEVKRKGLTDLEFTTIGSRAEASRWFSVFTKHGTKNEIAAFKATSPACQAFRTLELTMFVRETPAGILTIWVWSAGCSRERA